MLLIRKESEPRTLTEYKCQSHVYYGGLPETVKNDIRRSLLSEQGFLCAYCMRRIDKDHMKIEHWKPQNKLNDYEALDYNNLLGCCLGCLKDHNDKKFETCDTHKGKEEIVVDPRNILHIDLIKYKSSDGTIYSDDCQLNSDIDLTLNLNSEFHMLKENRRAKLKAFEEYLASANSRGKFNKAMLRKILLKYTSKDKTGNLPEYAGVIVWRLRKMRGYPFD